MDDELMAAHAVRALVSFLPTGSGGLGGPLPAGTPSLLWCFKVRAEDNSERIVQLGARVIPTGGSDIRPGQTDVNCVLEFWAGEARIYASPGEHFVVWYGGDVGHGKVIDVINGFAKSP